MSGLTQDGTIDSVLRHQIVRRERVQGSIKLLCSSSRIANGNITRLIYITYFKRRPWMYKAMYVRSSVIAEYGSTGKGCQSCSWSAEPGKLMCVVVCVFFPSILDIKFVGRTSRGHTGGRSHRIFNPPSFCGACLDFCREKDSAIPFPRRP